MIFFVAALWAYEKGLVSGDSFDGSSPCTRAQAVTYLWKLAGSPAAPAADFADVSASDPYAGAVAWAAEQQIVSGDDAGLFAPNQSISREQLAVMLWRYSGSPTATNKELHFNDTDEISGFALEALRWAVENGILNGYGDGRLGPQGQATRAQVAQMLKNFIENQEETT